jgi:hypothetical protein
MGSTEHDEGLIILDEGADGTTTELPATALEEQHWAVLSDPLNVLRLRRSLEQKYLNDDEVPTSSTRALLRVWGIDSPMGLDEHAMARYFGVDDKAWAKQIRSLDPAENGVEFVPGWVVKRVDRLIRDKDLKEQALAEHPRINLDDIPPMGVETKHDQRLAMSNAELDMEVRMAGSPQERVSLINTYLLPRIDEQEYLLKNGNLTPLQARRCEDKIEDIESRLREVGIGRILTRGKVFNTRLHEMVGFDGDGARWVIDEEVRAGYGTGDQHGRTTAIRKARVHVARRDSEDEAAEDAETVAASSGSPEEALKQETGARSKPRKRGSRGGKGKPQAKSSA